MKNTKKIICFLCCLLLIFSCSTISWSPHADAAMPVASYVASVVGSFILSAGFSFDNRGDFQSATEAFLESDIARGITEITDHVGRICALGNLSEPLLIHSLIKSDFFKHFWNSIYEFFRSGEIIIESGNPAPQVGYAFYNGIELPIFTPPASAYECHVLVYNLIDERYEFFYTESPIAFHKFGSIYTQSYNKDKIYPLVFKQLNGAALGSYYLDNGSYTKAWSSSSTRFYANFSSTGDFLTISNGVGDGSTYFDDASQKYTVIWSNNDLTNLYDGSLILQGTLPITEGSENTDVIGVYNNEVHSAEDIIASWARAAENGGAIDWALDSIPAYQDITSNDKDVPVTQTQTGVLTQSGVKVQTDEEVKEEVKQEAIKELENYTVTGLASIFPFCIPFDIYNFLSVLVAEREAPHFNFVLDFGSLGVQEMEIDLSGWETAAQILRTLELMAFIIGLALATHKLIKW